MAKDNRCPHCGAELPPDALGGVCPRCLMKAGLANDPDVTLDSSPAIEGPGTKIGHYELAKFVPDEIPESSMIKMLSKPKPRKGP